MEAVNYYSDEVKAFEKIRDSRWRNGVACPHCNSDKVRFVSSRLIWQCNGCRKQFSAKTGTIFEDSPIKLSKWLIAMWLIANAKNGISSYELHRSIGVTQKTAWFMLHRIRLALQNGSIEMLKGEVEADETYVGGIAKFMHYTKRQQRGKMVGSAGKTTVVGAIERGGKAVAKIVEVPNTKTLTNFILSNVETDSKLYTTNTADTTLLVFTSNIRLSTTLLNTFARTSIQIAWKTFGHCLSDPLKVLTSA